MRRALSDVRASGVSQ